MFKSWRSFWDFQREIHHHRRYLHTAETAAFLAAVADTCAARAEDIPKGWRGWRAQLGHDWRHEEQVDGDIQCAFPPDRMKPQAYRANEGRVNPKGIPCLYLASEAETAMSEVRPWVGSYISLAEFVTVRPLRVVNCSKHYAKLPIFLQEPDPDKREQAVWTYIDRAFSQPVTSSDDRADYASTQILAELFRDRGYDGLYYKSAFGENGYNIALFDLDAAKLRSCSLHEVEAIQCKFKQSDNTYYVKN